MTPSAICLIQFWEDQIENKQKYGGLLLAIEDTFYSSIKVSDLKISDYFISSILFSQNFSLGVLLFYLPPRGSKFYLSVVRVQEELQNVFLSRLRFQIFPKT